MARPYVVAYPPQPLILNAKEDGMVSPAAIRVARRAFILYTLMMRYTVETNASHPRAREWLEVLSQWLDRLEVGSEMEPHDAAILAAALGKLDGELQADARWSGEAAGVLGWALGRVAVPADFDAVDPNQVFGALGFEPASMGQAAGELLAGAVLRPGDECLRYYLRVRTVQCCLRSRPTSAEAAVFARSLLRQDLGDPGLEIHEGEFSAAQEGVARLSDEQRRSLLGNYVCRAHAAGWLVGRRERYWGEEDEDVDE
jgi:hypothetical protein